MQDLKGQKCVESELKPIDFLLLRLYSGRGVIKFCILLHRIFMYTRPVALNFPL